MLNLYFSFLASDKRHANCFILLHFSVLMLLFTARCGVNTPGRSVTTATTPSASPEAKKPLLLDDYIILQPGTLKVSGDAMTGTGTLLFKDALPSDGNSHFEKVFKLDNIDSKMTLVTHTHSSATSLEGGVRMEFKRVSGNKLQLFLNVGTESYDLSADVDHIDASQILTFGVDVHAHGHVILWHGSKRSDYTFSTGVPVRLWGVELVDATLTRAKIGPAKVKG